MTTSAAHAALKVMGRPLEGVALREAQGNVLDLVDTLRAALSARYQEAGRKDVWPDLRAVYADRVVGREEGRLIAYPYVLTENGTVAFGAPYPVEEHFQPTSSPTASAVPSAFIEAVAGQSGRAFTVRVVRAGLSGNGVYYPDTVLREAVPRFDGVRVFAKSDADHLTGKGKDVRQLIGKLTDCQFIEGANPDHGEIQATLHVLQTVDDWSARFTEALGRGMADIYGLSIDAIGRARRGVIQGKAVRVSTAIDRVTSVDLIVEPGAGGGLIALREARGPFDGPLDQQENSVLRTEVIRMIEATAPALLQGKDVAALSDEDVLALYREAVTAKFDPAADRIANDIESRVDAKIYLREAVAASTLPAVARERVIRLVEAQGGYDRAAVDAAIAGEREYLARFAESGRVTGLGRTASVQFGEGRDDKVKDMLDAFFDPAHKDHRHARSFKTCYREATGDDRCTGLVRDCDSTLMREALGTASWAEVLGDAITRRMVADYNIPGVFDVWRRMATVTGPGDFRVQERTRIGGYGDLPKVPEGADYTALTSPGDEKATYKVEKRGGLETVTLEMITNDDVGAIRRVPTNLSRSAKRTLGKFILDGVRTNAVIHDGKALGHVDHGNLGAAALGSASLRTARLAMLKQAELGSNEPLGIGPQTLWVPPDLEDTAVDLFRRNTENDKTFQQSLALDVVPVWYWTDANDWAVTADQLNIPLMEVGFLHGEEEPALFVQDNPTVGSLFAADKVTYKIRHIYGATVLDWRGFYVARVA